MMSSRMGRSWGRANGRPGVGAIGEGGEGDDALGVAAGGIDAGADGVVEVVLGGQEDDGRGAGAASPPGRGSPREMRAANSQRRVLLPRPGSPSRRVILPAASRPGESQRNGSGAT